MSQPETPLMRRIWVAASQTGARVFRNNTGQGWVGQLQTKTADVVTLRHARSTRFGLCPGSADLIGLTPVTVTPAMVGRRLAVFTALEVKTPEGRVDPEQQRFVDMVRELGGIAAIVRSEDDARAALKVPHG